MRMRIFEMHKYKSREYTQIEIAFLINRCVQLKIKDKLNVDDLLKYVNFFLDNFEEPKFIQETVFYDNKKMSSP